uniref:BTB domain-containing protein n=1 Tax=Glossina palpalis gambiensis TaxID=67801 RepID=A0A1B0BRM9_9MUSC
MFNIKNYEYDCTSKCHFRLHGNQITMALTKRSIEDEKLAAYVAKTCCNFADIVDDLGRSAVHIAASVDRYTILEWLLNQGSIISGRDFESGSTPLHRAIFYGCIDCAVLLLRYGASWELLDVDTRSPLQQVCHLADFSSSENIHCNDLLVWGSNKNYNLGVNNDQGAEPLPQMLEYFRKEHICLMSVALGAYHSLFLDKKGQVYTVGHGKGGRLGTGNENSLTTPKKVKLSLKNSNEEVICISTSRRHSLILTNYSLVFACGLNDEQQLGVKDAGNKLSNFKEVITLRDNSVKGLIKVIACDSHSLAYSLHSLYTWGTNVGQMGFDANTKIIPLPKMMKLPPKTNIHLVDANNAATVVLTEDNLILLFHNYKMKTIKAPNYESLKSISVIQGDRGSVGALKLLLLTQTNVVFLWYQLTQNFYRCTFSNFRLSQIDKILYKANQVLIMSQGNVYKGKCQQVSMPSYYNEDVVRNHKDLANIWNRNDHRSAEMSKEFMIRIDLQPVANIDRVVDIFCDDDFASFAVLQESHMKYFQLPTLKQEEYTFKKLYNGISEYDSVHDIVFHVDGDKFPAHKFIIYARAPGLKAIISKNGNKEIYLNFPQLTAKIFEIIMKFAYNNYMPSREVLMLDLEDIQNSMNPNERPDNLTDTLTLLINFVQLFQLNNFAKYLKSFNKEEYFGPDIKSKYRFNRLRRTDFPELHDISIVCENSSEILAHKCVLVARLQFFEMMFTHTWAEQNTIQLSTVPYEYMEAIIDFLYSLDAEHFRREQYRETFLYNMIVFCDQYFIENLREVCEILLLEKISIRKCGEMLDFACMYNCDVLKEGCMDFICQNMSRVLLQKSLHNCEPASLKWINGHYRNMFKKVFDYRVITPDSEAIDEAWLLSFVEDFQVDLNYRMDGQERTMIQMLLEQKSKDKQCKQTARQYEREAISTMMKSLHLNESARESEKSSVKKVEADVQALSSDPVNWMKVADKKELKKKSILEQTLKANEILKKEDTLKRDFVKLQTDSNSDSISSSFNTPEKILNSSKLYNINLAVLATSPREKLSQKQRKRLFSESVQNSSCSWRSTNQQTESKPTTVVTQPNAWGTMPHSPSTSLSEEKETIKSPPATGSLKDPTSFANMTRVNSKVNEAANSFSQILIEEKRQRIYYERMRHKSLVLTQIEEQAIVELRDFYNVGNLKDEIITIQRKPQPTPPTNFATWKRDFK